MLILALLLTVAACTPKTGERMGDANAEAEENAQNATDGVTATLNEPFRKRPPAPGPPPEIKMGDYEDFELDNGLKVIVVENDKLPRVSYQVFVDVPPFMEGDKAGYSSIAGDLLTRGTRSRSKAEIDEAVDFIGGSLSSSSRGFFGSALTKHQDALLEVMSDALLNPAFPAEEFDKVKKQTLSGLAQAKEDPNSISRNVANALRYGAQHPYGEMQTEATTENITVADAKRYYDTYFKPNNAYLIVVGDIEEDEAKEKAEQYFGKWQRGKVDRKTYPMPRMKDEGRKVAVVNRDGAVQSVLTVTYPVDFKPGSDDAVAAAVMNSLLGGSFGSRLNQNLREKNAWTYGARTTLDSDPYVGYFSAGASVRNEVTDSSLTETINELTRMRNTPISPEELQVTKAVVGGRFARSLDSPQAIARYALNTARYDLPEDYYSNYLKKIEKVTIADVQRVAKKYLHPDNAHILVVGSKDDVADKLKAFDADGKIDYYDGFGNPVSDVGMTVPDGMTAAKVIDDYLTAIGGKAKLQNLKDVTMVAEAAMGGQTLEMSNYMAQPNKVAVKIGMGGMIMQQTLFDGTDAVMIVQGQTQALPEDKKTDMMNSLMPVVEMSYGNGKYQTELKGIEEVNGQRAYKVVVTKPSGGKKTEFYDTKTGLKLRETETETGPNGQSVTSVQEFSDYKEVDGFKFPHTITLKGAMPMPLVMTVKTIEVNKGLDDSTFRAN